ncbi:MAG: YkgJ family cysteine cluster protein [Candidatus Hermodarchaeota archaeon]
MDLSHDFRFECIKCGNCCTDSNTIVNITSKDILRIKNGLSLTLDELIYVLAFYVFETELSEKDREKMVISPIKTQKGLAFVGLFKKKTGECYFYDAKNKICKIYNLRPTFCRTFPFSFKRINKKELKNQYQIDIFYSNKGIEYCPGLGGDSPLINIDKYLKLGNHALKEIELNEEIIKGYNTLVNENIIKPSVKNFLNFILNNYSAK